MAKVGADWDTQPELKIHLDDWRAESLRRLDPKVAINVVDRRSNVAEHRIAEGGYRKRNCSSFSKTG